MQIHRAGTVFDGERAHVGSEVVVADGRVLEVRAIAAVPEGASVVDHGPDTTILPGLVDGHQHLSWGCTPAVLDGIPVDPDLARVQILSNARRALAGGVTTIQDLGDSGYVVVAARDATRGDLTLPRILGAGPPITTPGGHCHFLSGSESEPANLVAAVRDRAAHGVDVVKVMVSGGNVTPGSLPWQSQYDARALRVAADAAREHGLRLAAHAHGAGGIRDCVAAGVHAIEHGTFMTELGVDRDPAVLDSLAQLGIVVRLTPGVASAGTPLPPAMAARIGAIIAGVREFITAGIRIVLSSDAGIGPPKPHDVLSYSVLQAAPLFDRPVDALTAATAHAADALGLGADCGRLTAGRAADILVRGDATRDVAALLEVEAVYREGIHVAGASSRPPFMPDQAAGA